MDKLDKRQLYGGSAAGAILLMAGVGTWLRQGAQPAALDAPLPPGAVEVAAQGAAEPVQQPAPAALADAHGSPEPSPSSASPSPAASATPAPTQIVVFVSGAVKRPGVYRLKPGARIESAIFAAGGFKPNALTDAINLADLAQDKDHVQVGTRTASVAPPVAARPTANLAAPRPSVVVNGAAPSRRSKTGETGRGRVLGTPSVTAAPPAPAASTPAGDEDTAENASSAASEKLKNPGDGVVNINTATAEELTRLPGVGPSTAAKIVEYRTQNGPFADVSQLDDVKGIGPKKLAKLLPFLSLK